MVRARRVRGVSTMEVSVAVVLLAAVAGTAAWMGPTQLRAIVRSHEEDVALRAATSRIERLRAAPPAPGARVCALDGVTPADLSGASATESIAPAGDGLVRVTVEVRWTPSGGGAARVVAETLVAAEDAQ